MDMSWSFDVKKFSTKLNETVRTLKEEVEQSVDSALGIENTKEKGQSFIQQLDLQRETEDDASTPPVVNDGIVGAADDDSPTLKGQSEEQEQGTSPSAISSSQSDNLAEGQGQQPSSDADKPEPTRNEAEESGCTTGGESPAEEEPIQQSAQDPVKTADLPTAKRKGLKASTGGEANRKAMQQKLVAQSKRIAALASELDDQKSACDMKDESIKELSHRIQALSKEKGKMQKQIDNGSRNLAKLKEKELEVEEILREGEKLSKRQHEYEQRIKELRAKVEDLEREKGGDVDKSNEKIASLQNDNDILNDQSRTMTSQLESSQSRVRELENLLTETQDSAARSIERLTRDLDLSSKQVKETEMQYAEMVAGMPKATETLVQQVEQLRQEISTKEATWLSARRDFDAKLQEVEHALRQSQRQEGQKQKLFEESEAKNQAFLAEIRELNEQITELENGRQTDEREEVSGAIDSSQGNDNEDEANALLQSQIDHLRAQLLEEKWQRETAEMELSKLKDHSERRLKTELNKAKAELLHSQEAAAEKQDKENNNEGNEGFSVGEEKGRRGKSSGTDPNADAKNLLNFNMHDSEQFKASLPKSVPELEVICSNLAEELMLKGRLLSEREIRLQELGSEHDDYLSLKHRHKMALEMMGEKDEEIELLSADILDLKKLYQEHITDVVEKLNSP
eukprot:CAMPEP_0198237494 /NCGR_PEP_ID=MMETSP1446-20131203/3320_1 /TAXON_ID=1461542 ORGANISM="Unidentified sp, Strain CCMP2111" /NCGR_SAMPLE_ID=MMETSP1446 /ASSEMBLY_ACC=CAM_ASM_001112 /LENGTH=683 /DNA_ID=CAMNT_0043919661 /DNA_START=102 /DNA_END=2153 /DNA_ORIENTATION=+